MTGKAYVAKHHSKALPLSIKGIRRNLRLKTQRLANIFL